jgi:hypothetical protein
MNIQINEILNQIAKLEDDLHRLINEQQEELHYRFEGTKIRFEKNIEDAQRLIKISFFRWLRHSNPLNVITAPFIYSVILPVLLLDLWITCYQAICFPLYRIKSIKRSKYIVIDHHHLQYLNSIEKLNCVYCSYVGGVFAFAREVAAKTEQYWCPIKHARKILDPHRYYVRFSDYGLGDTYHENLHDIREELKNENST